MNEDCKNWSERVRKSPFGITKYEQVLFTTTGLYKLETRWQQGTCAFRTKQSAEHALVCTSPAAPGGAAPCSPPAHLTHTCASVPTGCGTTRGNKTKTFPAPAPLPSGCTAAMPVPRGGGGSRAAAVAREGQVQRRGKAAVCLGNAGPGPWALRVWGNTHPSRCSLPRNPAHPRPSRVSCPFPQPMRSVAEGGAWGAP